MDKILVRKFYDEIYREYTFHGKEHKTSTIKSGNREIAHIDHINKLVEIDKAVTNIIKYEMVVKAVRRNFAKYKIVEVEYVTPVGVKL